MMTKINFFLNSSSLQNFAFVDSLDYLCRTPLMLAAAANLVECIDLLIVSRTEVNSSDIDGNTALHYAYAFGSMAAASVLELRGADNTRTNNSGATPLDVTGMTNAVKRII
jgi:ankyrin repeat protein